MRDQIKLATDIHRPDPPGSAPVILLRTPYGRKNIGKLGEEAAAKGYVFVAQDTRGRFDSEGENLPFHLDHRDGPDTVAWIAAQPWCNGRIGTWGGSAGAITQFQLAPYVGESIACQHLVVGAPNLYDVVYSGGVFRKSLIEDWIKSTRFATNALDRWVSHPSYDEYWMERDVSWQFTEIRAPAVHIGGYWDIFAQATIDGFVGYQASNRGRPGQSQKLVMGPWAHAVLQEKVGDLTFPDGKSPPGELHDAWRWFAYWLQEERNGIERAPAVTYYVLGDTSDANAPGNEWHTAKQWPPVRTRNTKLFLRTDGTLSRRQPGKEEAPRGFAYDPQNPVPTIGGVQLTIPAGPKDQAEIENRSDVLVFSSPPLTRPLEVTGRVTARLWVASDAPDTDFFVRLCDVYPDGRSFNLCEGRLRARFREGQGRESMMQPGHVYPLDIDLWSTSVIFNQHHRLRVHVTSSSAPGFDPNPNTGEPFRASTRTRVAQQSVYLDRNRPSHLILPVTGSRRGLGK